MPKVFLRFCQFALVLVWLSRPWVLWAGENYGLILTPSFQEANLDEPARSLFIFDETRFLSVEDLRNLETFNFTHSEIRTGSYTPGAKRAYHHVFIQNRNDRPAQFIVTSEPFIDRYEIFIFARDALGQRTLVEHQTMDVQGLNQLFIYNGHFMTFTLQPQVDYDLVLLQDAPYASYWNFKLFEIQYFARHAQIEAIVAFSLFSALSAVFFYNLFVMIRLKRSDYLFYNAFLFCTLLMNLTTMGWASSLASHAWNSLYFGYGFGHFWMSMVCMTAYLSMGAVAIFISRFCDLQKQPWMNTFLKALAWLCVALAASVPATQANFGAENVFMVKLVGTTMIPAITMAMAFNLYRTRDRISLYLFSAMLVSGLGNLIWVSMLLGFLERGVFNDHASLIGIFMEALLFSIALGDKMQTQNDQLTKTLSELNLNLEKKVEDKTKDIKAILTHIPEAIFQIKWNADLALDGECSHFLTALVGTEDIVGRDPFRVVFNKFNLQADELSSLKTILSSALEEDYVQWEFNAHLLPQELTMGPDHHMRYMEVSWSAITDARGHTQKILVSMRDVSELKRLEKEAHKTTEESKRLTEMASLEEEHARDFLAISEEMVQSVEAIHLEHGISSSDIDAMYRSMHTIKGLARAYKLKDFADAVHQVEETLKKLKVSASLQSRQSLKRDLRELKHRLNDYKMINNRVLGRETAKGIIKIPKVEIQQIHDVLAKMDVGSNPAQRTLQGINRQLILYCEDNLEKTLKDDMLMLADIAQQLGKGRPRVVLTNDNYIVAHSIKSCLRKVFVHIFRNAIDHGIESMEERRAKGKNPSGQLSITLDERQDQLLIFVEDDGQGLNLRLIREKAIQKGLLDAGAHVSTLDIARFIFHPGLSTSEKTTDISGRGVGLDAVKLILEENGCTIDMEIPDQVSIQDDLAPFRFCMTFPKIAFSPLDEPLLLKDVHPHSA